MQEGRSTPSTKAGVVDLQEAGVATRNPADEVREPH